MMRFSARLARIIHRTVAAMGAEMGFENAVLSAGALRPLRCRLAPSVAILPVRRRLKGT